jgi:CBS-domain-containing membrane protein
MLVRDVMTADPITVTRQTTIREVLTVLADHGISAVPVVDEKRRLYGIASEADLIAEAVVPDPRAHERPIEITAVHPPRFVDEVCTRSVVTVRPADDIALTVDLMASTGAKSLPVLDDDRHLVGIVSRSDVVAALARADTVVAADIQSLLESCGRGSWLVEVEDGTVRISGPVGAAERSLAHTVAHTVPGVVDVRIDD